MEEELGEMWHKKEKFDKEMERIVRESIEMKRDMNDLHSEYEEIDTQT